MEVLDATASKTVQTLVEVYGFELETSVAAVSAIGDKSDVGLAVSWCLDSGAEDRGGAVAFVHCPHLDGELSLIEPAALRLDAPCCLGCTSTENWACLTCGAVHCGRYVNKHAVAHHEATKEQTPIGHAVALSWADLSTWCYVCDGYVTHPRLEVLTARASALKFGEGSTSAANGAASDGAERSRKSGKQVAKRALDSVAEGDYDSD